MPHETDGVEGVAAAHEPIGDKYVPGVQPTTHTLL
jgi:hypothetical protein